MGVKMKKIIFILVLIIFIFIQVGTQYFYLSKTPTSKTILSSNNDKVENITLTSIKNSNGDKPSNSNDSNQNIQDTRNLPNPINRNIVEDKPLFNKEVFLTFDDGPSANTPKILKILNESNIKATFFVVGKNVDANPDAVRAEYKDGMTILNHSYTHEYSMYKSIESTRSDFDKCNVSIKNAIGIEPLSFIRFPGGSDNQVSTSKMMASIRNETVATGIEYIDWNTNSGDADKPLVQVGTIEHNLLNQLGNTKFAVTLMHDASGKATTVEALPAIIDYLKKQGYVFRTFADLTPTEEKEMINRKIINRGANK